MRTPLRSSAGPPHPHAVDSDHVAAALREALTAAPEVVTETVASDGTVKLLIRLADGNEVETVLIPPLGATSASGAVASNARAASTACVSSQVGCAMGCAMGKARSGVVPPMMGAWPGGGAEKMPPSKKAFAAALASPPKRSRSIARSCTLKGRQ